MFLWQVAVFCSVFIGHNFGRHTILILNNVTTESNSLYSAEILGYNCQWQTGFNWSLDF